MRDPCLWQQHAILQRGTTKIIEFTNEPEEMTVKIDGELETTYVKVGDVTDLCHTVISITCADQRLQMPMVNRRSTSIDELLNFKFKRVLLQAKKMMLATDVYPIWRKVISIKLWMYYLYISKMLSSKWTMMSFRCHHKLLRRDQHPVY